MKRYLVEGDHVEVSGFASQGPREAYFHAESAEEAAEKARGFFHNIDSVREVPWEEGRPWPWRLWRWLIARG